MKVLHVICQQSWKTQQWTQDWKRSVFISSPKKGNVKDYSNYHTDALISHTSKVILKNLQARLQQYMNHELPELQAGFRNGRETRDQFAKIHWVIEKAREFQKNISFCFIDYAKAFDCVDHNNLENSSRDVNTRPPDLPPENSVCRSRNNIRTGHGTTEWFQIGKGIHQVCMSSLCLFNLFAEYIKRNAGLDEAQAGTKVTRRNINNLRYAEDTT